jgi:Fic family protein
MTEQIDKEIAERKRRLDERRPLGTATLRALEDYYDVELTYTSNAIEGNTLSHQETALVIEKGITVGGKTLREHLEAADHFAAVKAVRGIAAKGAGISEETIVELHRQVVLRSKPEIAGHYATTARRVVGSGVVFPNPVKIPQLMKELGGWLGQQSPTPETAFEAHLRLVSVHPFADGNGRTARLLMNLILIKGGYPPMAIGPEMRRIYIDSIEKAQLSEDKAPYGRVMSERLLATLDEYLKAIDSALPAPPQKKTPKRTPARPKNG